ncbi:hypothetical protein DD237_001902 [Peronospora effusa]|uniref:Crinkler effector protein N-terminal domain-containing protein n=1 Tax=Peronospora effusa TaxID=542832 RepID=A0A425CLT3_9STRA|nr:hypothetical protein DD237_001902 [Peronospora effusa]
MVKLFCVIVGVRDSVFAIDIEKETSVYHLKKAIKAKNANTITCDAKDLHLFLAKMTDGVWLKDDDPAALELKTGKKHKDIQKMIDADQAIATRTLKRWLFDDNKMLQPSAEQIHVLVVASEKLKWESSPLGPHIYDSESQYFWLEKEDTAATGLLPKRLMLYCRPTFISRLSSYVKGC